MRLAHRLAELAAGLALPDSVFTEYAAGLAAKRDALLEGLAAAGMPASCPEGTYFVIADARPVGGQDAVEFCLELPRRVGVVGIPVSAFCDDQQAAAGLVRFAFCKRMPVVQEAARRLAGLAGSADGR